MAKDEIKTQPERKEREYIELERNVITDILAITDKDELVKQVRFTLEDGKEVTWKPKKTVEEQKKFKGLPITVKSQELIKQEELSSKIFTMYNLITENGKVEVNMSYNIWNTTDKEDNPVTYYYMFNKDYDIMEIQEPEKK